MTKILDSPAFNLIDETWIPCIRADGSSAELGLRAALLNAHQLRDLYGESPLMIASLYRLLLALLYSIYGMPTEDSWAALWQAGKFDPGRINAYLAKWRERFYLFHPERPFYQWAEKANRRNKSVLDLFPDYSSRNNATLFDHHTNDANISIEPNIVARGLLLVQTFSIVGGSGMAPAESFFGPWARGYVFLAEGNTIFQTLMLNYMSARNTGIPQKPDDLPVWESKDPFSPDRRFPMGMKDYLTWPTRAMYLVPDEDAEELVVRQVWMGKGLKLDKEMFLHPFYHYRQRQSDGKKVHQSVNEARALWRDSATFLKFRDEETQPPRTLYWLRELVEEGALDRHQIYRYAAIGLASGCIDTEPQASAAKIHFYSEEHFPLPADYLLNTQTVENLATALQASENVRQKLGGALSRLATLMLSPTADDDGGRKPDRKDVQNLMAHWAAERHYWSALETPFFQLMRDLPEKGEEALTKWETILQDAARQSLEYTARMAGDNARALRASVRARGQLAGGLKKLFEEA